MLEQLNIEPKLGTCIHIHGMTGAGKSVLIDYFYGKARERRDSIEFINDYQEINIDMEQIENKIASLMRNPSKIDSLFIDLGSFYNFGRDYINEVVAKFIKLAKEYKFTFIYVEQTKTEKSNLFDILIETKRNEDNYSLTFESPKKEVKTKA